jgi:hypothetical protein
MKVAGSTVHVSAQQHLRVEHLCVQTAGGDAVLVHEARGHQSPHTCCTYICWIDRRMWVQDGPQLLSAAADLGDGSSQHSACSSTATWGELQQQAIGPYVLVNKDRDDQSPHTSCCTYRCTIDRRMWIQVGPQLLNAAADLGDGSSQHSACSCTANMG